jgi:hypothetical protein
VTTQIGDEGPGQCQTPCILSFACLTQSTREIPELIEDGGFLSSPDDSQQPRKTLARPLFASSDERQKVNQQSKRATTGGDHEIAELFRNK